jgi:hypothetical protein
MVKGVISDAGKDLWVLLNNQAAIDPLNSLSAMDGRDRPLKN